MVLRQGCKSAENRPEFRTRVGTEKVTSRIPTIKLNLGQVVFTRLSPASPASKFEIQFFLGQYSRFRKTNGNYFLRPNSPVRVVLLREATGLTRFHRYLETLRLSSQVATIPATPRIA
jgi:hypothetical protein